MIYFLDSDHSEERIDFTTMFNLFSRNPFRVVEMLRSLYNMIPKKIGDRSEVVH